MSIIPEEFEQEQCWVRADSVFSTSAGPNRVKYLKKIYHLPPPPPGQSEGIRVQVPRPLVHLWLGDPDLIDRPENKARTKERERIMAKWGVQVGAADANLPVIHAWTYDGEYLHTVIADPDGTAHADDEQAAYDAETLRKAYKGAVQQLAQLAQYAQQSGVELPEELKMVAAPSLQIPDTPEPTDALVTKKAEPAEAGLSAEALPTPPDPTARATQRKSPKPRKAPPVVRQ